MSDSRIRKISRRDFLAGLAFSGFARNLAPGIANAFPLSRILGPGNQSYIQGYVTRLERWHEKRFGPIQKSLSETERRFCAAALRSLNRWDEPFGTEHAFDRVLYSHKSTATQTSHLRYAISPETWDIGLRNDARSIARRYGIMSLPENTYGLGWDLKSDEFKIYRSHATTAALIAAEPGPLGELAKRDEADVHDRKISCTTYRAGKVVETKVIVAYKQRPINAIRTVTFGPSAVSVMQVRRTSGTSDWYYRLSSFNLSFLVEPLRPVAQAYGTEFALVTHSLLWSGPGQQTLYYP